ncbi:hypothetical protein LguiA_001779 [Lonicera macranthoides]
MIALIRHAIDSGVTFLDTSDFYGPHINEILVGKFVILEHIRFTDKLSVQTAIEEGEPLCS